MRIDAISIVIPVYNSTAMLNTLVEVLWMDMEANPFDPWVKPVNGRVKVPQGPGLGCDPDSAIVARYRRGAPVLTIQGRT